MQKIILILISLYQLLSAQSTLGIYFDTPDLYLLKNDKTLKYQAKKYLTKKNKKIKYIETIIYESKTQKKLTYDVKHYNSVKYIEEKHPLLALIKRDQRITFKNMLKKEGIEYPLKLKYILKVVDSNTSYKEIFNSKTKDDYFFRIKFQYPYLLNLFYSLTLGAFGLLLIYILFRKRL